MEPLFWDFDATEFWGRIAVGATLACLGAYAVIYQLLGLLPYFRRPKG